MSDSNTSIIAILETALENAAGTMPEGEAPAVMAQIFFRDGHAAPLGAVKRGPQPGTYVIAQQAGQQQGNRMVPLTSERGNPMIAELFFPGSDISRLAIVREVQASLAVPDRRIVFPG